MLLGNLRVLLEAKTYADLEPPGAFKGKNSFCSGTSECFYGQKHMLIIKSNHLQLNKQILPVNSKHLRFNKQILPAK